LPGAAIVYRKMGGLLEVLQRFVGNGREPEIAPLPVAVPVQDDFERPDKIWLVTFGWELVVVVQRDKVFGGLSGVRIGRGGGGGREPGGGEAGRYRQKAPS